MGLLNKEALAKLGVKRLRTIVPALRMYVPLSWRAWIVLFGIFHVKPFKVTSQVRETFFKEIQFRKDINSYLSIV